MSRTRRLVRWMVAGLGIVLVLVVAGLVVVQTVAFKEWVRTQMIAQAAGVLEGELRVEKLSGSLWTGVTLDRVEIRQGDRPVMSAGRIRVMYNPWTLAHRKWVIDELVIERPFIEIADTGAGWNVQHLIKSREPRGAPPTFRIDRFRVVHSTIAIRPREGAVRWLTSVSLDGAFAMDRGVAALHLASLHAHDERTGLTVRELSGHASDNFRTFDARIRAESAVTRISGAVRGETSEAGRTLAAELDLTRADIGHLIGDRRFASDITGHLTARGALPKGDEGPRATFAFSGVRTAALGYLADTINATGKVDRGRVTFDARVTAYGARATSSGTLHFGTAGRAPRFTGHGRFADVDLRRLPDALRLPRLESRLAGGYDVSTDRGGWRAHADLDASMLEGAAIAAGTTGDVTASSGAIDYTASGAVAHLDLQRLAGPLEIARLAQPQFASDLTGRFDVRGREPGDVGRVLNGTATLEDSTVSGSRVPAMRATVDWTDRRLAIEAHGSFERLTGTTLGTPGTPLALTGQVDGFFVVRDLEAPWTMDNLEGDGQLLLKDSTVRDVAIAEARLDGRLADGLATIRALEVRSDAASIDANGSLGLESDTGAGVTLIADVPDLAALGRLLNQPIAGVASLEATIAGTVRSPTAAGAMRTRQLAYRDRASAFTGAVEFSAEWPDRHADRLSWELTSHAEFVEVGDTKIQSVVAKVAGGLREMTVDVQAEQQKRSVGLEGLVVLNPDSREFRLRRLALTTEGVAWALPEGQVASIRHGGDTLTVTDLALVRGDQHIGVAGSFAIGESAASSPADAPGLDVTIRNVELADLNRALLGARKIAGRLDGTVRVSGTRQSPAVDADVVIKDGSVEDVPFASAVGRVTYAERGVGLDFTLDQSPGAQLRATGEVRLASADGRDGAIDLTVSGGPIHLGLVQAFTGEVSEVGGTATVEMKLTGSPRAPAMRGTVDIAGGALVIPATGSHYRDLNAQLQFADSRLTITRLELVDGDGDRLTAEGGLDLPGGASERALDVRVRADNVNVLRNRLGTAEIDADLRIAGTFTAPIVRGTTRLESGRLEVAEILERTTSTPYSTEAQAPLSTDAQAAARAEPSLFERADVEIELRLPDNLLLRGRDLRVASGGFGIGDMNIVTGGTFDIAKRPGVPMEVLGTLEVVRGSYTFQGRRFDVARGSDLRFRGGPVSDPLLDVRATREVSGVTAEVRLRGTARTPEVSVASQPPLDEGDVLSLIVFNQPVTALGAAERVNLGERAAAFAAGAITSPLADSIAQALNLDLLEIQAPTSEDDAGVLTIGGRLGSRVFVGLRQQFGRDDSSLLSLEYRVSQVLRFVTSVAQGSLQAHATRRTDRGGVDLLFVIRY